MVSNLCMCAMLVLDPLVSDSPLWEYENKVEKVNVYAKKRKSCGLGYRKLDVLYNYGERGEYGDWSSIYVYRANCDHGTVRTLTFKYFVGEMATGDVAKQGGMSSWRRPESGTLSDWFLDLMCSVDLTLNERILRNWGLLGNLSGRQVQPK
jgi:hypothetical protein